MSFDHYVMELGIVEEFYDNGVEAKGTEEIRKMFRAERKVTLPEHKALDNCRNRSVL